MDIQDLKALTNESGRGYLEASFLSRADILGATTEGAKEGEFFVLYKSGSFFGVFVLPLYGSDKTACFGFGSVKLYSAYLENQNQSKGGAIKKRLSEAFGIPFEKL